MKINSKPTRANFGGSCEYVVAADLMAKGWEVFMHCGANSKADIVARSATEVLFFEVRQPYVGVDGFVAFNAKSGDNCDFYAGVVNGDVVYSSFKEQTGRKGRKKARKWEEPYKPPGSSKSQKP